MYRFRELHKRDRMSSHRMASILKILVRSAEPLSIYRIEKELRELKKSSEFRDFEDRIGREVGVKLELGRISYPKVLDYVKNRLRGEGMVEVRSGGKRGADLVEVTMKGFVYAMSFGYLSEGEVASYMEGHIPVFRALRKLNPREEALELPRLGGVVGILGTATSILAWLIHAPVEDAIRRLMELVSLMRILSLRMEGLLDRNALMKLDPRERGALEKALTRYLEEAEASIGYYRAAEGLRDELVENRTER